MHGSQNKQTGKQPPLWKTRPEGRLLPCFPGGDTEARGSQVAELDRPFTEEGAGCESRLRSQWLFPQSFPRLVSGRGHRPHPGSVIIQSSLEITKVRYFYPSLKKHGFHGAGSWYVGSRKRKASKSWILLAITSTSHAREVAIVP